MPTFKITTYKGEMPGPMATEWWTKEQWDEFYAEVEELKRTGEYGRREVYTVTMPDSGLEAFDTPVPFPGADVEMVMFMPVWPPESKPPLNG